MKADKISESGRINEKGQFLIPMDRLNAFFRENAGKRVIACFEVVEPGSTDALQRYYYGYVLPTLVEAYKETGERKRLDFLDNELSLMFPFNDAPYKYARYFPRTMMIDFLDWLKQFAAENLHVYIEDPRTI